MQDDKENSLIVMNYLEPGGATRVNQDMTQISSKRNYILLTGLLEGMENNRNLVNEFRLKQAFFFPLKDRSTLLFYLYIFFLVFIRSLAVLKKYSISKVFLNVPVSSLAIIVNPFFIFKKKIYIFHGSWAMEERSLADFVKKGSSKSELKYLLMHITQYLCLAFSDEIHVFSDYSKKILLDEFSVPIKKIIKVKPFLPGFLLKEKVFIEKHRRLNGRKTKLTKTIFYVPSRWEPRKGIHLVFDAIDVLRKRNISNFTVIFSGSFGSPKDYVIQLFKRYKDTVYGEHIKFTKSKERNKELIISYLESDCILMPSLELETLGLVSLESLFLGVPVLGFAVGANSEILSIVDKQFLISKGINGVSLADKMHWFMKLSNGKRENLSEICTKNITNFLSSVY